MRAVISIIVTCAILLFLAFLFGGSNFYGFFHAGIHDRFLPTSLDFSRMESAIGQYQTAHRHLPIANPKQEEQDNSQLIYMLGAIKIPCKTNTDQPYLILSPPNVSAGAFLDPWGHKYHIYLDVKGAGFVTVDKSKIAREVVIWSDGPNGTNEYGEGDDVSNWKQK